MRSGFCCVDMTTSRDAVNRRHHEAYRVCRYRASAEACTRVARPYGYFCVLHEAMLEGVRGCGRPARQVELDEDVAQVASDGLLADGERVGDALVRLAGGHEAKHLDFPRRQDAAGGFVHELTSEPFCCGKVGRSRQRLERAAGRFEFHPGAIAVAERPAGAAHEDVRPRGLIRRVE